MKWFKFYGQDFLTDPKMRLLSLEETMCWIVLLCLANAEDKRGKISFVNEDEIMMQAKLDPTDDTWSRTQGFIRRFESLRMLRVDNETVTERNGALRYDVTLINFERRQEKNLSNAERQKRYREKVSEAKKDRNNSNVTKSNDSNARTEQSRTEQSRTDITPVAPTGGPTYSYAFLEFWNAYPKKVGKGAAWRAWERIKGKRTEEIIATLQKHCQQEQWTKDNGRFIPNPATWLNQRRWEDEVAQPRKVVSFA